jgi:hypothetical protein
MGIRAHSGFSVAEALVALFVSSLIAAVALALFIAQARLARQALDGAEALDAVRVSALLLPAEARVISPRKDLHAVGPDSAALRVFRGAGVACAGQGGAATIRYRGLRDPDPAKDSILILSGGSERMDALAAVGPPVQPCTVAAGETVLGLTTTTTAPIATHDVLLFFESGAYHLSARALRYRPPGGTRQPLTADVLDAVSGFALLVHATQWPDPVALAATIAAVQRGRTSGPPTPHVLRIPFLNANAPLDSAGLP